MFDDPNKAEAWAREIMAKGIKKIREELNLEPKELAYKMGYHVNYVYNFERQEQKINFGVMDVLARLYERVEMPPETLERVVILRVHMLDYLLRNRLKAGIVYQQHIPAILTIDERQLLDRTEQMNKNVMERKSKYILKDAEWVMSLFGRAFFTALLYAKSTNDVVVLESLHEVYIQIIRVLDNALEEHPIPDNTPSQPPETSE